LQHFLGKDIGFPSVLEYHSLHESVAKTRKTGSFKSGYRKSVTMLDYPVKPGKEVSVPFRQSRFKRGRLGPERINSENVPSWYLRNVLRRFSAWFNRDYSTLYDSRSRDLCGFRGVIYYMFKLQYF
jgi:hypothetical protein